MRIENNIYNSYFITCNVMSDEYKSLMGDEPEHCNERVCICSIAKINDKEHPDFIFQIIKYRDYGKRNKVGN